MSRMLVIDNTCLTQSFVIFSRALLEALLEALLHHVYLADGSELPTLSTFRQFCLFQNRQSALISTMGHSQSKESEQRHSHARVLSSSKQPTPTPMDGPPDYSQIPGAIPKPPPKTKKVVTFAAEPKSKPETTAKHHTTGKKPLFSWSDQPKTRAKSKAPGAATRPLTKKTSSFAANSVERRARARLTVAPDVSKKPKYRPGPITIDKSMYTPKAKKPKSVVLFANPPASGKTSRTSARSRTKKTSSFAANSVERRARAWFTIAPDPNDKVRRRAKEQRIKAREDRVKRKAQSKKVPTTASGSKELSTKQVETIDIMAKQIEWMYNKAKQAELLENKSMHAEAMDSQVGLLESIEKMASIDLGKEKPQMDEPKEDESREDQLNKDESKHGEPKIEKPKDGLRKNKSKKDLNAKDMTE